MVEEVGQKEGISQSLLQHAKCRHPRNMGHDADDDHDHGPSEWEVWALEPGFPRHRLWIFVCLLAVYSQFVVVDTGITWLVYNRLSSCFGDSIRAGIIKIPFFPPFRSCLLHLNKTHSYNLLHCKLWNFAEIFYQGLIKRDGSWRGHG